MKGFTKVIATLMSAVLLVMLSTTGASAKRDQPPPPPPDTTNVWEWYGGTPQVGSLDGPKSSNSYNLGEGASVYRRGFWDVPLSTYQAGFSYKASTGTGVATGGGSPRISIFLAMPDGTLTGELIYLDPDACPSAFNSAGWATSNFFRSGSSCTIFGSWSGVGYTGKDAVPYVSAATSAWNEIIAHTPNGETLASYGFLIADVPNESTVIDRVIFGGNLLSKFATNASPDSDNDGVIDRYDTCGSDTLDADADGTQDCFDSSLDINGTYSGTANDPAVGDFAAAVDQTATLATDGHADSSNLVGGDADVNGCFPLTGDVTVTFGSHHATGTVRAGSTTCPDTIANDGSYDLDMWVDLASGSLYGDPTGIGGAVHFVGDNSAFTSGVIRNVTGTVTGSITH